MEEEVEPEVRRGRLGGQIEPVDVEGVDDEIVPVLPVPLWRGGSDLLVDSGHQRRASR
jgi:hypothetical protein